MSAADIAILAACAQVVVLMIAAVRTVRGRFRDVLENGVRVRDIVVTTDGYTEPVKKLQANLSNQFETPVYFFAAVLFGLQVEAVGWVFAALAWFYVATRLVHHVIHTGWNNILYRMTVFLAGLAAILVMWAQVALTILVR